MSPQPLVILGGGGHSREIIGIVGDINRLAPTFDLVGVLADKYWDEVALESAGVARIGSVADLEALDAQYIIGIGDGQARRQLDSFATSVGRQAAMLVHPAATLSGRVTFGPGFIAFPGVRVTTEVTFGRHVHLNLNATVSHDCVVDDYVTLSPGASLAGRVTVGSGSTLGVHASVIPDVIVGADVTVGAGAVVITDVPPGIVVAGVPARPLNRRSSPLPGN